MVAQQSRSRRYFQAASTCPPPGATVAALHTQKSRLQRGKFPWNWKHAHAASQRPNKRQYIQRTFYLHDTLRAPLRFAHSGRTRFFPSSLRPISASRPNQVNVYCLRSFTRERLRYSFRRLISLSPSRVVQFLSTSIRRLFHSDFASVSFLSFSLLEIDATSSFVERCQLRFCLIVIPHWRCESL